MFIKRSSQSALISIRNLRLASTSSSNPAASTINKPITSNQLPSSQLIKSNREPLKHKAKKSKSSSTSTSITSTLSLNDSNKITNSLKTTNILTNNINNKSNILTELNLLNSNNLNNNNKNNPSSGKAIALSTAESYNIPSLAKTLSLLNINAINLLGEAIYLPKWSPETITSTYSMEVEVGEIFVFESGSIVSWGLSSESLEIFLRKVIRSGPELSDGSESSLLLPLEFVEKNRYAEAESEVLEYWIEPNSPTRMQGDSIYLNSSPGTGMNSNSKSSNSSTSDSSSDSSNKERENLLARLAFSAGMSRVTKLGVYEEQFDEFAAGIASIPLQLEQVSFTFTFSVSPRSFSFPASFRFPASSLSILINLYCTVSFYRDQNHQLKKQI